MSWWSYRVSIQFSLLCLILSTDFHKNTHFRPNMLNNLNMTFTFGKQTKDNFMKRKFKRRPYVAVDCTALNYWGKHKRKMAITNRKATSSSRAPSTSSLYYYYVALSLYRDKRITIIRLWWLSQWLVTYRHHLAVTIYLHIHSLIFVPAFSLERVGGSSPRRTRNTSRSTAISDSSAGSTPRQDQARSEI